MCLFAECCVNVLCKYFILHGDQVSDQLGSEKENYPHTSSWCTVRVRPNWTMGMFMRYTHLSVEKRRFSHCLEVLLQSNSPKNGKGPTQGVAGHNNRVGWMIRQFFPNNSDNLNCNRVPSVEDTISCRPKRARKQLASREEKSTMHSSSRWDKIQQLLVFIV
jgi:hypothetical protein